MSKSTPKHIAFILDGNRSWAKQHGFSDSEGHLQGVKNIIPILTSAIEDHNCKQISLFLLSTENLKKRSKLELNGLFSIFDQLDEHLQDLKKFNPQFRILGAREGLAQKTRQHIDSLIKTHAQNSGPIISLAINYGSRDEIIRAASKWAQSGRPLSEAEFESQLDSAGLMDLDLLIRTGGHQRLSNFLLWQASYAEIYFSPKNWPAFTKQDLASAITWFSEQKRKRGQ